MTSHPVERWHALIKSRDPRKVGTLLADDVVFYSPILYTPQRGKQITSMYLMAAFHVLLNDSFKYVHEITAERSAMLEFETQLDDTYVNGIDLMHFDDDENIIQFKVMVRPFKATQLLHDKMKAMLAQMPRFPGPIEGT